METALLLSVSVFALVILSINISIIAFRNPHSNSNSNSRLIESQQAYLENAAAFSNNSEFSLLNFTKSINLSNNTNDSVYGQVAASGKDLYVVWEDSVSTPSLTVNNDNANNNEPNYDIFIKKSIDGGETFSKRINLSNNQGFSENPQISAYGNNVYVVWTDNSFGNNEIFFRKSIDGGKTFSKTISMNNNGSSISGGSNDDSSNQEIAAYGNNVYVVWQQQQEEQRGKPGDDNNNISYSRIVFRSSSDAGSTFENAKVLTNNATTLSYPKVAAASLGNHNIVTYVVWNAFKPLEDKSKIDEGIFFTKSTDNGNSFSNIAKINGNVNSIGESQIAAYGNNVYVVWAGIPDLKIEGDIFFTKSNDNGNSFLTNPVSLGEKNSLNVEVAAHENNVFVSWQGVAITSDNKENEEIFIKRSIDYGDTLTRAAAQNISNNAGVSECASIALAGSKAIYVVWEDNTFGNHEIQFSRNNAVLSDAM